MRNAHSATVAYKATTALALVASGLCATGASGETTLSGNFTIDGYIELGYFDRTTADDSLVRTDIDLAYTPSNSRVSFGLGLEAFHRGGGTNRDAIYASVSYNTDIGTFTLGVPRSVLDRGYMPAPIFANNSYFDLEFGGILGSAAGYNYLTSNSTMYGARYDGEFGNTKVGVSVHDAKFGASSAQAFALAASHSITTGGVLGELQLYGGIEHVRRSGGSNETDYRVGAEAVNGRTTAGLTYADKSAIFGADVLMAYASYDLRDDLTLTGSYAHIDVGGGTTRDLYGVGFEYRFYENAYVKASYVDGSTAAINPTWEVMVGWRF